MPYTCHLCTFQNKIEEYRKNGKREKGIGGGGRGGPRGSDHTDGMPLTPIVTLYPSIGQHSNPFIGIYKHGPRSPCSCVLFLFILSRLDQVLQSSDLLHPTQPHRHRRRASALPQKRDARLGCIQKMSHYRFFVLASWKCSGMEQDDSRVVCNLMVSDLLNDRANCRPVVLQ